MRLFVCFHTTGIAMCCMQNEVSPSADGDEDVSQAGSTNVHELTAELEAVKVSYCSSIIQCKIGNCSIRLFARKVLWSNSTTHVCCATWCTRSRNSTTHAC